MLIGDEGTNGPVPPEKCPRAFSGLFVYLPTYDQISWRATRTGISVGISSSFFPSSHAWTARAKVGHNHPSTLNRFNSKKNHNQKNHMTTPEPMLIRGGDTTTTSALDMMSTNTLITSIIPRLGIITSTLLYFSPMSAVRAASKANMLGELNPVPLALMSVASLCWLVYGLSIRNPFVTLSNLPGYIASLWYVVSVLPLLEKSQLETMQYTVVCLSALTVSLWTYLSLSSKPLVKVQSTLGIYASGLFVILSGSPLSTIKTVLSTRNAGSILLSLTIAQVTNTALWSVYGLAIKDKFVYGPNMVGLGFGLVQLLLKGLI